MAAAGPLHVPSRRCQTEPCQACEHQGRSRALGERWRSGPCRVCQCLPSPQVRCSPYCPHSAGGCPQVRVPGGAAPGSPGRGGAQRWHRGAGGDGVPSCRARCWWRAKGIPAASAPGQVSPGLGGTGGGTAPCSSGCCSEAGLYSPRVPTRSWVPHGVCPRCRWQCDGRPHGTDDGAHPLQRAIRAPQQPAGHLPTASPGRYVRPPLTQRVPLGTSPAVSPRRG